MFDLSTYKKFIDRGFKVVPTYNKTPMSAGWQDGLTLEKIKESLDYQAKKGKHPNGVGLVMLDNLEALDFDTKHDSSGKMMEEYRSIVLKERPNLYDKIIVQKTQSGGEHWVYKCEKRDGNSKLARNKNKEAVIETRGIGGQIVVQPTDGYKFIKGGLSSITEISVDERAYLWGLARTFNEYEDPIHIKQATEKKGSGKTAFNDYDDKATLEDVKSLFTRNGWKIARETSKQVAILRDGSNAEHSGYIFKDTLRSFIYSTSTIFEPEKPYLPYAVYTMLEHGGDYKSAARELYKLGYGEQDDLYTPTDDSYKPSLEPKKEEPLQLGSGYVPFSMFKDKAEDLYNNGNPKGNTTRFDVGDSFVSYRKKHTTYIFAQPTSGKTQWGFSEMVHLAENYGWKFAIHPSESGDPDDILAEVASIYIGKLYTTKDKNLKMSRPEKERAQNFFQKHFFCIDPLFLGNSPIVDAEYIIEETKYIEKVEGIKIDGIFIDPVTELDESSNERTDKFIKRVNSAIAKDAKANDRHNILVYHVAAQTPLIDKDTNKTYYPEPHPREIAGGQNAYKQGDQVINVFRPVAGMIDKETGREFSENETHIIVHKSRPKGVGRKGRFVVYYDWMTNRYYQDESLTIHGREKKKEEQSEMELKPDYAQPISKENFDFDPDENNPF